MICQLITQSVMIKGMRKSICLVGVGILFGCTQTVFAACTDIPSDIGIGSTGTQVMNLQMFLKDEGLLTATPNGTFGPATTAAVKRFQAIQKISSTGFVGPTTRASIKSKSCVSTTTSLPQTPAPKKYGITLPAEGSVTPLNTKQIIRLAETIQSGYDVILENEQGVAQGYINVDSKGERELEWHTGNVFSVQSHSDVMVEPGIYRIRIRNTSSGSVTDGPLSAFFTLTKPLLKVTYLYPSDVSSDEATTVALFGVGLDTISRITIDGSSYTIAQRLYTSPDGTIYVFSVPKNLSKGVHQMWINNGYENSNPGISISVR